MRTNIEIDPDLIAQFMAASGVRTKREAVETALREALRIRKQEGLRQLWGIGWEGDLDEMRTSKHIPED